MFGLSWLSPTILGAVGIALLASLAGGWTAHKFDGIALARSQAQTASVTSDYSQYRARVAEDAARGNAAALSQRTALEASNAALAQKLAETQRNADAISNRLKAILNNAAPQDVRPLGPVSRAYFDRLRQSQAASPAAAPGH